MKRGHLSLSVNILMAEGTSTRETLLGADTLPHLPTSQLPKEILRLWPLSVGQVSISSHGGWEERQYLEDSNGVHLMLETMVVYKVI